MPPAAVLYNSLPLRYHALSRLPTMTEVRLFSYLFLLPLILLL